jgi:hypothetical protein
MTEFEILLRRFRGNTEVKYKRPRSKKKVDSKASPMTGRGAYRVMRRRGSHTF